MSKDKAPAPGVYITRPDTEKVMAFPANFECQLTPTGDLCLIELVPDVANDNKGEPIAKIRRFIAAGQWHEVVVI